MSEAQPNPDHPDHGGDDSFAGDAADGRLDLAGGVKISRQSLDFTFSRSRGPGGQSVNKVNTRAQLRVRLSDLDGLDESAAHRLRQLAGQRLTIEDELLLQCDTHRSQRDNRRACFDRLCALVEKAVTPPRKRKRTRPTRAMIERRLRKKQEQSEKKQRRRSSRNPRELM